MKIISKFKDYYDSVSMYGVDESQIYLRKTTILEDKNEKDYIYPANLCNIVKKFYNRSLNDWRISPFTLNFCGKHYQGFKLQLEVYPRTKHICYTIEELEQVLQLNKVKLPKTWLNSSIYFSFNRRKAEAWFDREFPTSDKINLEYKTAYWVIDSFSDKSNKHYIGVEVQVTTLHPILKDLEFYKVKSFQDTYQEINQYYFGVIGGPNENLVEIEDKYRIAAHGFDKFSFRKAPSKRGKLK